MNILSKLYKILYLPDINPTKLMLGVASFWTFALELIIAHNITFATTALLMYSLGLFWIYANETRRHPSVSCAISTLGASIWTYEGWSAILTRDPIISHIVITVVFSLASLWLFVRSGNREKSRRRVFCPKSLTYL